jgi:hypothetical protein
MRDIPFDTSLCLVLVLPTLTSSVRPQFGVSGCFKKHSKQLTLKRSTNPEFAEELRHSNVLGVQTENPPDRPVSHAGIIPMPENANETPPVTTIGVPALRPDIRFSMHLLMLG